MITVEQHSDRVFLSYFAAFFLSTFRNAKTSACRRLLFFASFAPASSDFDASSCPAASLPARSTYPSAHNYGSCLPVQVVRRISRARKACSTGAGAPPTALGPFSYSKLSEEQTTRCVLVLWFPSFYTYAHWTPSSVCFQSPLSPRDPLPCATSPDPGPPCWPGSGVHVPPALYLNCLAGPVLTLRGR